MEILVVKNADEEELHVEINSTIDQLLELEQRVHSFLGPDFQEIDAVLIGLHEMMVNAMEHGNKFDAAKKVFICVSRCIEHLRIDISDEGEGFDWKKKVYKPLKLDSFAERGRGIPLTGLCFDVIFFNSSGNSVSLIKYIKNRIA